MKEVKKTLQWNHKNYKGHTQMERKSHSWIRKINIVKNDHTIKSDQ
jgi:hypothetical protein